MFKDETTESEENLSTRLSDSADPTKMIFVSLEGGKWIANIEENAWGFRRVII